MKLLRPKVILSSGVYCVSSWLYTCSLSCRLKKFKASLLNLFKSQHAQSLELDLVREQLKREHQDKDAFSENEMFAAIERMMDDNQVMLSDQVVFLIWRKHVDINGKSQKNVMSLMQTRKCSCGRSGDDCVVPVELHWTSFGHCMIYLYQFLLLSQIWVAHIQVIIRLIALFVPQQR